MTGRAEWELDVSRETLDRLRWLEAQVIKWTHRINLISKASIDQIWARHIVDSIQVFDAAPPATNWLDLGSGGGFPGLVVAILAKEKRPDLRVNLMDSDQRKCTFLRTIVREAELNASVMPRRIEAADPQNADVISARALADLDTLLGYCDRHLATTGTALLQKGETWPKEEKVARQRWRYKCEAIKSATEPRAVILKLRNIARV